MTTNFAFIQRDGVPTGPPGPDTMNNATATPNGETLLMNQGDRLRITIKDVHGDVHGAETIRAALFIRQAQRLPLAARSFYLLVQRKVVAIYALPLRENPTTQWLFS